jgi:hypothetical protein
MHSFKGSFKKSSLRLFKNKNTHRIDIQLAESNFAIYYRKNAPLKTYFEPFLADLKTFWWGSS